MIIFPYLSMIIPIIAGCTVFAMKKVQRRGAKLTVAATAIAVALAGVVLAAVSKAKIGTVTLISFSDELSISFRCDSLQTLFAVVTNILWLLVFVYSIGYMKHERNEDIFYGFMLITLGVMNALYFSDNLLTLYLFFELATLASMPMVLSSLSKESITAAQKYLFYSVGGAFLALFGVIVFYSKGLGLSFGERNLLTYSHPDGLTLTALFLMIVGFGTKAGMYPMHGWLPTAHPVAPSPASALLSGLIAEAGVFAVIRITRLCDYKGTWVQYAWLSLALLTVFLGSMMAYREKHIKKRLAYSTVSQVSYIMVGLACGDYFSAYGSTFHYVFHAIIKIALFMAAGSIIMKTGKTNVGELEGVGKDMPVTMISYTLASLGLIGIPPACGFFSKYYLCIGALRNGYIPGFMRYLIPAVLIVSALLTAGYLLPLTVKGFFPHKDYLPEKRETSAVMYVPLLILGILTFAASLLVNNLHMFIY